jgi:hypothetical protein
MDNQRRTIPKNRRHLSSIMRIFIFACVAVFFVRVTGHEGITGISYAAAQDANEGRLAPAGEPADGNQKPAAAQPVNPSVNTLTQEAVRMGVLSCVSRINQVATFLTANTLSGVFIFPVQQQPDKHIFSASFEMLRQDNSTIYASASFFPNQDAVYDTVEYVSKSCEEMEKTVFKNLKRIGVVKKNIVLLDGGTVKVFLMPAGSGCVIIKKEVVQ